MSRLNATFARLRSEGRQGLVSYVVAGDPSPSGTVELLQSLDVLNVAYPLVSSRAEAGC